MRKKITKIFALFYSLSKPYMFTYMHAYMYVYAYAHVYNIHIGTQTQI